ncbi:nuclease-related domain-containing protein [Methanobacterium alcaliphilum]|uniref:nuclease-related domain-containing protein n=1 Tax=Methanobacterium alcaliphilum TaxID=392018 RepID=UPI002009F692|nr:nuclease-related domain-containing protein [Methanobacterium alcaliphilum]MCK9151543.1 NERD domain-containing protein [Methanobacterium alcaliphilum]
MKNIICKNCGAKYRLGNRDIHEFKCSECGENLKPTPRAKRSYKSKRKLVKNHQYYAERRVINFAIAMLAGVIIALIGLFILFITGEYIALGLVGAGGLLFIKASKKRKIWKKGVRGERKVARYLNTLPQRFFVFNDVTLPNIKGNIDHIVVGPTGVFAIETKNYLGRFQLTGDDLQIIKKGSLRPLHSNPCRQSRYNATRLSKYISAHNISRIRVRPVVTFINKKVDIKRDPLNYDFTYYDTLTDFILNQRATMDYDKVKACASLLMKYAAEYSFFE